MNPLRRLADGMARWLRHPWLPLHLALLAVVLSLPALGVGWQLDDHFHRFLLTRGSLSQAGPLEIFSTLRHGPEIRNFYVELGSFPWWTAADFRIAFVRHLSAATSWLDFRLWPLVAAATSLYRRIHGRTGVAGLAALLFAIDDAHGTAAGWLANRNALIASLFGILFLLAHDRWRRGGHRRSALLAPMLLALALAGGELALGAVAYLAAYALFLDPAPLRRRIVSLLPAGAVLACWATLYRGLGFGAAGSGLYIDPLHEPLAFSVALLERAPFYLAGQLTPLAADLGSLLAVERQPAAWWLAVGLVLLLAVVFTPLVASEREARFWALGSLLSIVPLCATFPTNRVLLLSGLGALALVALWLERWWLAHGTGIRRWAGAGVALALVFTHFVLAPVLRPVTAGAIKSFGEPVRRTILSLPADRALADQDLIVVNAPDYLLYVSQMAPLLLLEGRPSPRRVRGLAIGPSAVEVVRTDARTLEATLAGGYLDGTLGSLYRKPSARLEEGETLALEDMSATILATSPDGRPQRVRFRFDKPLESASLRWVAFADGVFVPFALPEIGQTIALPAAKGPFDILLD